MAMRVGDRRFAILEPARSSSGQRLYTEDDVERVSAVCRLVAEGLTLSAAVTRVRAGGNAALSAGESDGFLLRHVIETADQGIWVTDSGRTRYVNRRMSVLMGCAVEPLVMRPTLTSSNPS